MSKIIDGFISWLNRCRTCDVDGIDKSFVDQRNEFMRVGRHKTAIEYRCEKCGTLWVLADQAQFISRVYRPAVYAAWKSQQWLPNATQLQALRDITGVPDYYGANLHFPCKVTLPNGNVAERALLTATNGGCFGKFPLDQELILLDASHVISPSDYALPASVRAATMLAPEKSMGYAPVNVKDGRGNRYTLSAQMDFFDHGGIRGPDLVLDGSTARRGDIVHPESADLYLICDMFECEAQLAST